MDTQQAAAEPRSDTDRAVFYGDERGVCNAREWAAGHVSDYPRACDIILVLTELASNAIRHTASKGGLFTVLVEHEENGLAIVVRDRGSADSEPHVTNATGEDEHGHGMALISGLVDGWGTSADPSGRETWRGSPAESGADCKDCRTVHVSGFCRTSWTVRPGTAVRPVPAPLAVRLSSGGTAGRWSGLSRRPSPPVVPSDLLEHRPGE